jgi:hypothetical protein
MKTSAPRSTRRRHVLPAPYLGSQDDPRGHHAERNGGTHDGDGESVDQEAGHPLLEPISAPRDVIWITLPRRDARHPLPVPTVNTLTGDTAGSTRG